MFFHKAKEKPLIYGSFQDRQYSIWRNLEDIYRIDHESAKLIIPAHWGLPPKDYSKFGHHVANHGTSFFAGSLNFKAANSEYIAIATNPIISSLINSSVVIQLKSGTAAGPEGDALYCERNQYDGISIWKIEINPSDNNLQFTHRDDASTLTFIDSIGDVADGNVNTIALIKEGTAIKYYINRDYDSEGTLNGTDTLSAETVSVGADVVDPNSRYNGQLYFVLTFDINISVDQNALFHDRSWDLYRRVGRPVWNIPSIGDLIKNLADTISLSDTLNSKAVGLNRADTISLSDSLSKAIGINQADTISLSDDLSKTIGLNKADTITLSDDFSSLIALIKSLEDTISMSDTLSSKAIGLSKADTISLSDSLSKAISLTQADSIILSDNIIKNFGLNKADTISLSDDFSSLIALIKLLEDTISMSDTLSSKAIGLNEADTISLSDSLSKAIGINQADSIILSDSIIKKFGLNKADTITLSDNISTLIVLTKLLEDTISMSDTLSSKVIGLNRADTISLSDSLAKTINLNKADTIALTDFFLKNIGAIYALFNFIAKTKTFNFTAKTGL